MMGLLWEINCGTKSKMRKHARSIHKYSAFHNTAFLDAWRSISLEACKPVKLDNPRKREVPASPWYRRAQVTKAGELMVGSLRQRVAIEHIGTENQAAIDAAYLQKYARYAKNIVDTTVTDVARVATLRLTPAGE